MITFQKLLVILFISLVLFSDFSSALRYSFPSRFKSSSSSSSTTTSNNNEGKPLNVSNTKRYYSNNFFKFGRSVTSSAASSSTSSSTSCAATSTSTSSTSTNTISKKSPKIIITGAPASGKGTQCESIIEQYGVVHLSTGDILRDAVKNKTPLGLEAEAYMSSGRLVPDSLVISLVLERLEQEDCKMRGWLLDGFPRTSSQAEALLKANHIPDLILLLDVKLESLIQRVIGRRLDPETKKVYHLDFFPPPNDEEVLKRLVHRADDTEEKVRLRFQDYEKHVESVVESFKKISIIETIKGDQKKDQVTNDLMSILKKKFN